MTTSAFPYQHPRRQDPDTPLKPWDRVRWRHRYGGIDYGTVRSAPTLLEFEDGSPSSLCVLVEWDHDTTFYDAPQEEYIPVEWLECFGSQPVQFR